MDLRDIAREMKSAQPIRAGETWRTGLQGIPLHDLELHLLDDPGS